MKKVVYIVVGLMCVAVTFVACFDAKDFEFDKFTVSDLTPTLYLPLVDDTIRLDASGDYNVLYDEEGVGYLHFDIEDDILPPVEEFFNVPDASLTVSNISFYYPGGNNFPIPVDQISSTVSYPFSSGQQIDSIVFKAGTLNFKLTSTLIANGTYTVTIPELKKNGVPFSANIPFSSLSPAALSGYSLKLGSDNAFDIKIGLIIQSSSASAGDYTFNAGISFENVEIESVYGYFGQQQISPPPVALDISTFDKFRNSAGTILQIKEAFLDFRVDNGAGFPIRLHIDEVTSISGGLSEVRTNIDSVIIPANWLHQSYHSSEQHIGGEALGEVLSNMPSEVEFKFSATINPEGNGNGTVKNFLTDGASIKVSHIGARIPLNFSVSGMVLKDTLNFSSSRMTFENMELLLNVENSMPVAVDLHAYLMDENDNVIAPLFKTPVSIPAATVGADGIVVEPSHLYGEKIEANVEGLAQTKKLKVEIIVNTDDPTSQYVRVTKDNYVHIKIGAKAIVNVNNLD